MKQLNISSHLALHDDPPFDASIPNDVTVQTFESTDAGYDLVVCEDAEEMFTQLGI